MKWFKRITITIVLLIVTAIGLVYLLLSSSKAQLDGSVTANSLSSPVTIARDQYGMVKITASNQLDAFYAQGYAHGQDRFFQMDLLRRNAAGELSELFGHGALSRDKKARFHQFRQRAQRAFALFPDNQRAAVESYTRGVNAALDAYTIAPFEYLLTGSTMRPWQVEDSLLAIYSMYMDLQGSQVERDLTLTYLHGQYGQEMVDFLLSPSSYQAAIDGSTLPLNEQAIPELPLVTSATTIIDEPWFDYFEEADIGSNNWAVSAQHTKNERALLANDMHLGLNLPAIWYRAQIQYPHNGEDITVVGVSLPGAPGIIVGSNLHAAWGFTNANVDNVDWIALPDDYATSTVNETIVTTEGSEDYAITMSEYGPVQTIDGQRFALRWVAHTDYAVSFDLLDLAHAHSVDSLMDVAQHIRIPVQNMMMADSEGQVAYRLTGAVTSRAPLQSNALSTSQFATVANAWQQPEMITPIYRSPTHHKLWTANARVLSTSEMSRYGDGGYALGPRGVQIANRLKAQKTFDEQDFLALQLDNRAIYMKTWRDMLLATLEQADDPQYDQAILALQNWQACACANDVGYTLARYFRTQVMYELMTPLYQTAQQAGVRFSTINRHLDTAVLRLLEEQPTSWLAGNYKSYDKLKLAMYQQTINKLASKMHLIQTNKHIDLSQFTWGKVNELNIRHPISTQVPVLAKYLDMRPVPGFGDSFMPGVQNGTHGASQRFIVQPGLEENGFMSLPGGQSGHPLSKYYDAGFEVYAEHQGLPLLFQQPQHKLTLRPH